MDDKIRQLCAKVLATEDPVELQAYARELQQAIHRHVAEILEKAHARALAQIQPSNAPFNEANQREPMPPDATKGPQV